MRLEPTKLILALFYSQMQAELGSIVFGVDKELGYLPHAHSLCFAWFLHQASDISDDVLPPPLLLLLLLLLLVVL